MLFIVINMIANFLIADNVLALYSPYFKNGSKISQRSAIAVNYIKTRLFIDWFLILYIKHYTRESAI